MKLLFILPEYLPHVGGGIVTFYQGLLPELANQGHQVDVLVGSAFTTQLANYQANGVTVHFLDHACVDANLHNFDRYHAIPELQRHLTAAWTAWEQVNHGEGYDLIETTDWGLLFVPWITSYNSPPTVVQLHGSIGQIDFHDPRRDSQLQGSLIRLLEVSLLSVADELQTSSRANAQAWQQLIGREVACIPPALPVGYAHDAIERSDHGLVVGRIQYWKGVTILCEAMRLLNSVALRIDWLGRDTAYQQLGGSMAQYLAQHYPELWGTTIRPIGTLAPDKTRKLQAAAGFILVPSIWDVFNYTCIEGMAQAQTVLCSLGAGASDLITNGVNGFTFTANDPYALAEKLEALFSLSKSERKQIGEAAQQTIQTQLAPAKIAQQRVAAYEKLLHRGKCATRPNPWLVDAVSPGQSLEKPLAFLDLLPLKELSTYILKRSFQKVMK